MFTFGSGVYEHVREFILFWVIFLLTYWNTFILCNPIFLYMAEDTKPVFDWLINLCFDLFETLQ